MVILAEIGIKLHVFAEVMHPSHVPLKGKSKAIILWSCCYLGPCCRFLSNCKDLRISSPYNTVKVLEKLYGVEVLVVTKLIRYPLAILLAVVKIEH